LAGAFIGDGIGVERVALLGKMGYAEAGGMFDFAFFSSSFYFAVHEEVMMPRMMSGSLDSDALS